MTKHNILSIANDISALDATEFSTADVSLLYEAILVKHKEAKQVRGAQVKSRLKEGQSVSFVRSKDGTTLIGKVDKIKRTRAIVLTQDGGYDVTISELTILDDGI